MVVKAAVVLTPGQSQAARRELTLSQNQVIAQTGIQAYKLKQFEGRGMQIELAWRKKLREFYELQGVDFDQLDASAATNLQPTQSDIPPASRPGFLISENVSQDQTDRVLDRMDENDGRIAELIAGAYTTGMFGDVTEETEAAVRELFGLLAESHLLFRFLQGKNIITAATDEPKTIGDKLSQWVKDSPAYEVFDLATAQPVAPKGKAKALPAGDNYDDQAED